MAANASGALSLLPRQLNLMTTSVVCVAQDVTDQKAHEEQIHLLMSEISHRARTCSVSCRQSPPEPRLVGLKIFIERFTDRIQALAANQDLLVQTSGKELMSRIWCAPSSHTLPILSGPGSRCRARLYA